MTSYPFIACIFVAKFWGLLFLWISDDVLTLLATSVTLQSPFVEAGGISGSFSNALLDPEALDYDDATGLCVGR